MHRLVLTSRDFSTIAISGSCVLHGNPCLGQLILRWKSKKERKKALDFPKLFNAPNGMPHLGLSGGAGGWVRPSMGMLHLLKKAGFPLLFIHSGANTLNL